MSGMMCGKPLDEYINSLNEKNVGLMCSARGMRIYLCVIDWCTLTIKFQAEIIYIEISEDSCNIPTR